MANRTNREAFRRLAPKRVNSALRAIELIGNLDNSSNYSYTANEARQVIEALKAATRHVERMFYTTMRKPPAAFKLEFSETGPDVLDELLKQARSSDDDVLEIPEPKPEPEPESKPDPVVPTTASGKRTYTVVFPDRRQKKTVSAYRLTVAVICPYKKSYRVCEWFTTVKDAYDYVKTHPKIEGASVTPVSMSELKHSFSY